MALLHARSTLFLLYFPLYLPASQRKAVARFLLTNNNTINPTTNKAKHEKTYIGPARIVVVVVSNG